MNILVTGGAGYIGSIIVEHLITPKNFICIIDDLSTGNKQAIHKNAKFYQCDICDYKNVDKIFKQHKFECVIHLAAKTRVGESVSKKKLYYDVNVNGTKNIIKCMKKYKCKYIVFASSAAVYGNPKTIPIKEDSSKLPINPYGETKLVCENLIIKSKLKYAILRFANVSGASNSLKFGMRQPKPSLLIPIVNRAILRKQVPIIFGDNYKTEDGTCIRDYIHVEDIANICELSINKITKSKSLILNVCSNVGYSVKGVINLAYVIDKSKINYTVQSNRPGDPDVLLLDNSNLKKYLGYKPKYSIGDMIKSDRDFLIKNHLF
jgi:UDP-glucose 4-epimerase